MMFENGLHIVEEQFKNFMTGFSYSKNITSKRLKVGVMYCSGIDTSVLLDVVNKYQQTFNYEVTMLYMSYSDSKRGKDADDLAIKKAQIFNNKIKMEVCQAKRHTSNYNELAREMIKRLLTQADELDLVFTSDTADVVLESFLFNALSGCSAEKLQGSDFLTTIKKGEITQYIGRPFLNLERAALMDYARAYPIEFYSDDEDFNIEVSDRNYIRNNLIPLIVHRFNLGSFIDTTSSIREHIKLSNTRNLELDIKSGDWDINDFLNLSTGNRMFLIREYFKLVHDIDLSGPLLFHIRTKTEEDLFNLCIPIEEKFVLVKEGNRIRVNLTKQVSTTA